MKTKSLHNWPLIYAKSFFVAFTFLNINTVITIKSKCVFLSAHYMNSQVTNLQESTECFLIFCCGFREKSADLRCNQIRIFFGGISQETKFVVKMYLVTFTLSSFLLVRAANSIPLQNLHEEIFHPHALKGNSYRNDWILPMIFHPALVNVALFFMLNGFT